MKLRFVIALLAIFGWRAPAAAPSSGSILPLSLLSISSIQLDGTNVVVTVQVSSDFQRVTLEGKTRIEGGTWEPVAVQRPGEFSTQVKIIQFRVPLSAKVEMLRVRGDSSEALPAKFYAGTNSFSVPGSAGAGGGVTDVAVGAPPTAATPEKSVAAPDQSTRAVVESDIWKIEGDTLYFFNQYRGLQVIDIAKPDVPRLLGTYELPAAGEQMYLLDGNHIVLLARDRCYGWGTDSQSQLILLEVTAGQPKKVAEISVPGYLRESRLVGTALYVVSERYRVTQVQADPTGKAPQQVWEWGSHVASFDLADFSTPKEKSTEWVAGYGNAIMATERFLFVANPPTGDFRISGGKSQVRVFDISAPDGTMQFRSSIPVAGQVKDKFKMNLDGDIFTVVTENWSTTLKTQVETFSLADPKNPTALGSMLIIEREQLHATRFAGKLLYAVTFLRIDPLWVIDLSDPTRPKKVGELEIPGWSTYIQPLGDRLLTIGIDNTQGWRTAVQLFSVSNPAKPALLSKVLLGDQHSSSEANQDEKAFGVLPDEKLVLVPFTSWEKNTYVKRVQIIDLETDSLRKRGAIDHQLEPRRATVHRDRILSVSGVELQSVDATDRDNPRVTATTELSWSADRAFVHGDYLLTIAAPYASPVSFRISLANEFGKTLKEVKLGNLPLLGAVKRDQRLLVLQGKSTEVIWPPWNPTNYVAIATNKASLSLSVYDLSRLPELPLLGQSQMTFDTQKYWANMEAIFPKPGLIVWSSSARYYPLFFRGGLPPVIDFIATGVAVDAVKPAAAIVGPAIWWGGYDSQLLAFDVNDVSSPKFVSEVNLRGTNNWWNSSKAFAADGLVYMSHQTSEFDKDLRPPPYVTYRYDGTNKPVLITNIPPPGTWVQKFYLDVVNYADPREPSIRKPVNIPGTLIGISHQGAMLYTQATKPADTNWSTWAEWVDASAYDGASAHLVDSLPLPTDWQHPVLSQDKNIFLGRPKDPGPAIETWAVNEAGKFARIGSLSLTAPADSLSALGTLLTAQQGSTIQLFDASNPASLKPIGGSSFSSCAGGYTLDYADGTVERGLWIPLGPYGVSKIEIKR